MRKTENGAIEFDEEKDKVILWFIKYFWAANFWKWLINRGVLFFEKDVEKQPKYPSNICELVWKGLFSPFWWVFALIAAPLCFIISVVALVIFSAIWLFQIFFGFLPALSEDYCGGRALCHQYKRYGNYDEKKYYVAPWEIVVPGVIIFLAIWHHQEVAAWFVSTSVGWFYAGIAVAVLIVVFGTLAGLIVFFQSAPYKLFKEYWKAKKEKRCTKIVYKRKEVATATNTKT